ncbi:Cytochrome P450 [Dillenia turbinata]|uniref:Cytochrome P450 n=1 Tax=Dillenia turbinata TaxID=194707 RepID=A0AAN8W6E6_9MAGN
MEFISSPHVYYFPICIAILSWWWVVATITRRRKLPPGPRGWPIVKNIFDLDGMAPHRTLASLSQTYGPVIWLELGAMKTIVVQSSEAAKELFKNHDLPFADRKLNEAMKCCEIYKSVTVIGPYGPHWKLLRRLYNFELFTNRRMIETASLRRKCVDNMINMVWEEAQKCGSVKIAEVAFLMAFNLQCQLVFCCDINELPHDGDKMEFFKLIATMTKLTASPNLSDFFPYLQRFDLQGIRRKMTKTLVRGLEIISAAVEQRIEDKKNVDRETRVKDFLDVLLDYEGRNGNDGHENLSRKDTCAVIMRFDWVLEDGVTPETLDMGERFGTALRKSVPLKAVPKPLMAI